MQTLKITTQDQGRVIFVPDEFFYGVLDYYFAVGVWGFRFWAWDKFFKAVASRQQFAILHNLARII